MNFPRLMIVSCVAVVALVLSGCGGGGGGTAAVRTPTDGNMPPPARTVGLTGLHGLGDWLTANPGGMVSVPAGEHRDAGGVRFSCPADGDDCRMTVTQANGATVVSSTGGMASADVINPQYWILEAADSLLVGDSVARGALGVFRIQSDCTGTTCTISARSYRTQDDSLAKWRRILVSKLTLTPNESTTVTETHRGVSLNSEGDYHGWLDYSLFVAGLGVPGETYPIGSSIGYATGTNPTSVTGSATWSGVMVGVDVSAQNYRNRIQGDADLTIADLTDPKLDVAFTSIIDVDSSNRQRADMTWDDVPMTSGGFATGSDENSIQGKFYGPNHEEVGGIFERDQIIGAFGAKRQ